MSSSLGARPRHGALTHRSIAAALAAACALSACTFDGGEESPSSAQGPSGGNGVVDDGPPPALADLAAPGDVVGSLEVVIPAITPFVVRGTLPVPARTHVEPSTSVPFQLRGPDGVVALAQIETVTRWPRAADGADVVQVLARVDRPASAAPGARVRYDVVYQPHGAGSTLPSVHVESLLSEPGALRLLARDVFGHAYEADLWADGRGLTDSARSLKRGRVLSEVATHEVLRPLAPTGGPTATLPHLMGAHAYVTRWTGEDFVSIDLRIHNAFSGRNASTSDDDPLGKLYFESLELSVPAGWTILEAVDNPWSGPCLVQDERAVKPLVRAIEGGALHVMPPLAQFHRRVVIARAGAEARAEAFLREEGVAFCRPGVNGSGREHFSWWNGAIGRWFPQRHALPDLGANNEPALRAALSAEWNALAAQVRSGATGTYPIESGNLGWAHPFGIQDGGMVSGAEIYLYDGADVAQAASVEGLRAAQLRLRMYTDRQPNVMFDADGRAARAKDWVVHASAGSFLPIWWYNAPMFWASDPFGYGAAPGHQVAAVAAAGRAPWYEGQLLAFEPIDWQHLVRYTRSAKTLLWLDNDTLAKEDLVAQAEGFLFGYSNLPQDLWGNIIPTGMLAMQNYVAAYPGMGLAFGRGESWGLDAVLCAYSTMNDAWRAELLPWARDLVAMLERGQSACSGIIQASPQYNVFGGQYRCRQSIEAAIMENALVGLRETVLEDADPAHSARLNEVLRRALYAMVSPYVWSNVHNGPWAMMAVGPFDMAAPPFCTTIPTDGNYGFADHYQAWSSLAYGYELTHDALFLQKASAMLGGLDLVATLTGNPLVNWQNRAALTQLAQALQAGTVPGAGHAGP
ncbi:MAG: hypothetical protein JNK02_15200 [Planctomycetes bacterium]|nr:hypothetical protein [Planctomycetota bacterium]